MNEKNIFIGKIIFSVVLLCIIIFGGIYIYNHKNELFKTTVTYPDGCVEEYIRRELVTEECHYDSENLTLDQYMKLQERWINGTN